MDINSILPMLNNMRGGKGGVNPMDLFQMMNGGAPPYSTNTNSNNSASSNSNNSANPLEMFKAMQNGGGINQEMLATMFPNMRQSPIFPLVNMMNSDKKTNSPKAIGLNAIVNFAPADIMGRLAKYFL